MSEHITQKLPTPEGCEFDRFDEETQTVYYRPVKKVKTYKVKRLNMREYWRIDKYGIIDQFKDASDFVDNRLAAFRNYDAKESEMILARDKFKLDRKLRIAENEENPEGWVISVNEPGWAIVFYPIGGWGLIASGSRDGKWFLFGSFATKEGAQNFLDSLTDDEKETMLKYWRIKA